MVRRKWWMIGLVCLVGCAEEAAPEIPVSTAAALPASEPPTAPAASRPSATASAPASTAADGPQERRIDGIQFTVPADWEERPLASTFISAEYRLPGPGGPARLTLSTAGGDVEGNIKRWIDQFQRGPSDPAPKRSKLTVIGMESEFIELSGTFLGSMEKAMSGSGDNRTPNAMMLGIVVPAPNGRNYFLKLTGPQKTVEAQRAAFEKFATTAKM